MKQNWKIDILNLKITMKQYNISAYKVSKQSGVDKSVISRVLRYEGSPTLKTYYAIKNAINEIISKT